MRIHEFGPQNAPVILLLHRAIPGSALELLPGLRHGDLSINRPETYVQILTYWIGRNEYDHE